jgi:ribonuclease-3
MMISEARKAKLNRLEDAVGYRFQDIGLLHTALIHRSYVNEHRTEKAFNERLEFLGDAAIELVVSEKLFKEMPDAPEGKMTKLRSQIVCEPTLALAAKSFRLGEYLLLGKGEDRSGGRQRESLLSDAFEAVCGALYLDAGYEFLSKFLVERFYAEIRGLLRRDTLFHDYKTMLQEHQHKKSAGRTRYRIVQEEGPDHDKTFTVEVLSGNRVLGQGVGSNKKLAEQDAARRVLESFGLIHD